jgi:hypothetical protein
LPIWGEPTTQRLANPGAESPLLNLVPTRANEYLPKANSEGKKGSYRLKEGDDVSWDNKRWAVEFTGADGTKMIIGRAWASFRHDPYEGEPRRALLFCTRDQAREWCRGKLAEYAGREDYCSEWRFRPVMVRETVKKVMT